MDYITLYFDNKSIEVLCDGLYSREEAVHEVVLDIVKDAIGDNLKCRIMDY